MAKSIPARWPALSLALALVAVAGVSSGSALPAYAAHTAAQTDAAPAAPATPPDVATIAIAPVGSSILRPGQNLQVAAVLHNPTAEPLSGGTVSLSLVRRPLESRSAVQDWLGPEDQGLTATVVATQPLKGPVPAGQDQAVILSVPAAAIGLAPTDDWGARGIEATFTSHGAAPLTGRSTIIWAAGAEPKPNHVSLVVPITTPPSTTGLIPAADLGTFTGVSGVLTRQLDAVIDRPVTIAIDPMILASIRVLGRDAPPSATAWLERLSHAQNDIFPLTYADSDMSLESQAGAGTVLRPTSFEQAIDPSRFSSSSPTPAAPATGAPAPTVPAPGATASPTSEPAIPADGDVTAWNYTETDVGWPAAGTATTKDLDVFASSGLTTTILSGSELNADPSRPGASAKLGKHPVLVSDDTLSTAIRRAADATSDTEWRQAVAEAQAQLAIVAAHSDEPVSLLATLDRGSAREATRLGQTIDALTSAPWNEPASLGQARVSASLADVVLRGHGEDPDRVERAQALLKRESEVTAFATALVDPVALTGEYRLDLLATLGTGWMGLPDDWQAAVASSLAASSDVLNSVTITTEGPFLVVASQTDIPITLSNDLDQAVKVRVRLVPSNGRLLVNQETEATIDAGSAKTVRVPVTAKVGNGTVMLRIAVHSPSGVVIGNPKTVSVNVQAEWEGIGAVIFGVLVVLFFGFGVWRNIARRRRERSAESAAPAEETHE